MIRDDRSTFLNHYQKMFDATQNGDRDLANIHRKEMENLRQKQFFENKVSPPESTLKSLTTFANLVLNKTQVDLGINHESNCINAALNFFEDNPVYEPIGTMDFLGSLRSDFIQVDGITQLETGDLVVLWSRNGDEWAGRKIAVDELCPTAPEFPFGLVFDHVAVFIDEDLFFHKPDPRLDSPYQVNSLKQVIGYNDVLGGFELTYHQRRIS